MDIDVSADRPNGVGSERHPIRIGDRVMSRRRIAGLCGVKPGHIGMIFSGRRNPSIALAAKIAKVYEVTIDEVLSVIKIYKSESGGS